MNYPVPHKISTHIFIFVVVDVDYDDDAGCGDAGYGEPVDVDYDDYGAADCGYDCYNYCDSIVRAFAAAADGFVEIVTVVVAASAEIEIGTSSVGHLLGSCNEVSGVHDGTPDLVDRSRQNSSYKEHVWCVCGDNLVRADKSHARTRDTLSSWYSGQYEERYTLYWCKR